MGKKAKLETTLVPVTKEMGAEEILKVLVDAVCNKEVDEGLLQTVVQKTIHQYRNKIRVTSIGISNVLMKRIVRLIGILDNMDDELLLNKDRIRLLDDKEFARTYAVVQTSLMQALQYIQKTSDMQLDIDNIELQEVKDNQGDNSSIDVKLLSPAKRERIRAIINVLSNLEASDE